MTEHVKMYLEPAKTILHIRIHSDDVWCHIVKTDGIQKFFKYHVANFSPINYESIYRRVPTLLI